MTQASRPQADNLANFPAPSDPGPYSADQWAELFQVLYTGDQQATQGPLVCYLNGLEITDNGSTEVYVDTGAGIVNGHVLISSEQETWVIPAGPAGTRTDRVVMVENNSNAEVTQSTAARPLLFPNDLSEYTATPGVPAYSARLAILRGNDAGALPALDQTTTLYMVELARYDIDNVPAITLTDYREWAVSPLASVQLIDEVLLTAAAGTITFDNIPGCFRNLKIVLQARSDMAALLDTMRLRFNNDAGANNYDVVGWTWDGAGATAQSSGQVSYIGTGYVSAANALANIADGIVIEIPNYAQAIFFKSAIAHGQCFNTVGHGNTTLITQDGGWWNNTAAITRIDLFSNADNFIAGSSFSLYGLT